MGEAVEGYVCSAGRYDAVQPVRSWGRMGWLRSRVLGLDLRSRRRDGATVLVFRDPRTGEEFDGALEEAERRRRIAERERRVAEERAGAAERQVRQEARLRRAAEDRASAAEAQVRELKERLRNLAAATLRPGRDP